MGFLCCSCDFTSFLFLNLCSDITHFPLLPRFLSEIKDMWATCEKPLVCLRGSCVKADGRWWDAHGISAARMGPGLLSAALQEARRFLRIKAFDISMISPYSP